MKFRHGDVLIETIDCVPREATPTANNILAEGEVTGHAHRYFGGDVLEHDGVLFGNPSSKESEAFLDHEDHGRLDIPAQPFRVTLQREYDDEQEWRNVAD